MKLMIATLLLLVALQLHVAAYLNEMERMPTPPRIFTIPTTTKAPDCSGAKFDSKLTLCREPPPDMITFATGDTQCSGSIVDQSYVNKYYFNQLQNATKGNAIELMTVPNNGQVAKAACFVNCYLNHLNLLVNGTLTEEVFFKTYLSPKLNDKWKILWAKGFWHCADFFYAQDLVGHYTYSGNSCDGRNLAVLQCMQKFAIGFCPVKNTATSPLWTLFNKCEDPLDF